MAGERVKFQNAKKIDNFHLFVMCLIGIVHVFIFSYIPMGGIILAFKQYNVIKGIFKSPWVGLENFRFYFYSADVVRTVFNTVVMNLVMMSINLVNSVTLALALFEVTKRVLIRTYQSIFILPRLISWVIVSYITYMIFLPSTGYLGQLIKLLSGNPNYSVYTDPLVWRIILPIVNTWKDAGFSCLFYYATLLSIDNEIIESAKLDGANRWQIARFISIPHLIPTIITLFLIGIGSIFRGDFGLFFFIPQDTGALYPTTDIIDTYIYRALMKHNNIGVSAAVGLIQSVVGFITVTIANKITKRFDKDLALY